MNDRTLQIYTDEGVDDYSKRRKNDRERATRRVRDNKNENEQSKQMVGRD